MSSCPECLRQVEPGSQFCVSCGAVLPDTGEMSFFATLFRDEPAPTVPEIDDDATRIRPAVVPAPPPASTPPQAFTPASAPPRTPTPPSAPHRAPTPPSRPRRIGGIVVLIVVLAVAVAAAVAGVFALGGSGQQTQPTPTAAGATPTPTPTHARSTIALPDGAAKACSPDVAVNSTTSCPFAQNVAAAVWAAGPMEPLRVRAHSPVTNRTYDLTCTRGEWIRCTGGTNAIVYVLPR